MVDKYTQSLNDALVDALKARGNLQNPQLEAAFRATPRHKFLPKLSPERAYTDDAIAIKRDPSGIILSSSSQPTMTAIMLNQLQLRPHDNVLEIGAGTGYSAALMQHIVGNKGKVTTIDIDPELVEQAKLNLQHVELGSKITVVAADGALGYAPRASYDRILASVGVWDIPPAWINQLRKGGILVAPLWLNPIQISATFQLQDDGTLYSEHNMPCGFIPLRGSAAGPQTLRRVASTPLALISSTANHIDTAALHTLLSDDTETSHLGISLKAHEFWSGFLPYLMLNTPAGCSLALYQLLGDKSAYGIQTAGFALLTQGSACFVSFTEGGTALSFASADALIALQDAIRAWDAANRPTIKQLRLKLVPHQHATADQPASPAIRIERRRDHDLHLWLAPETTP